jgi:hypothetical protein
MHGEADGCAGQLSGSPSLADTRPWRKLAIDIVLDCSARARAHLEAIGGFCNRLIDTVAVMARL